MMRQITTLTIILLAIGGCAKPVAFHPDPEERVVVAEQPAASTAALKHAPAPRTQQQPPPQTIAPPSSAVSIRKRASVPDFTAVKGIANRKRRFFSWLQPIVQQENQRILQQRKRLLQLRGRSLNRRDHRFLDQLSRSYGIKDNHYSESHLIKLLLLRVDAVPVDLVLAQAAIESAWGTSRFAREGNNLFGEWCHRKGCGLVPKQRLAGASHEVRFFTTPAHSVRAYLHNINTGKTYNLLRQLRHKERQLHQPLSGYELALGLKSYSERGMAYVRIIRHLIRTHTTLMHAVSIQ